MPICPGCHSSDHQVKMGFTACSSQRFLCKTCRIKYTPHPKDHSYPNDMVQQALRLHEQGISNRAVGRILRINHQTVANWINENSPPPGKAPSGGVKQN